MAQASGLDDVFRCHDYRTQVAGDDSHSDGFGGGRREATRGDSYRDSQGYSPLYQ